MKNLVSGIKFVWVIFDVCATFDPGFRLNIETLNLQYTADRFVVQKHKNFSDKMAENVAKCLHTVL